MLRVLSGRRPPRGSPGANPSGHEPSEASSLAATCQGWGVGGRAAFHPPVHVAWPSCPLLLGEAIGLPKAAAPADR